MTYQSMIVFLNRRCPVGCATCNAAALPGNDERLSELWISEFFRSVNELDFSGYIVWTGGEPFLSFETLKKGVALADNKGYHSEILTSGIWFDGHPERLEPLAEYGNVSIRISLDAEHQEKVPISRIVRLISRALELRLEVNFTLREIPGNSPSPRNTIEDIKQALPEYYRQNHERSRWIHYIPHMPISLSDSNPQAENKIDPKPMSAKQKKPCKLVFRDLVIGADGLVYPCCGLFSLPFYRRLAVGDPLKDAWDVIASRRELNPSYTIMRTSAPCHLCLSSLHH